MTKKIKSRNRHYFWIEVVKGQPPIRIGVPVVNATETITFRRTEADVRAGKQGMPATCANIMAAKREKPLDRPVYHWEFTPTRAYAVDLLGRNGTMERCVRFQHDQREFQQLFDKKPKRAIIAAGLADAVVTLRPPKERQSQAGLTNHISKRDSSRGTRIPNNGARRLWQAGFDLDKLKPVPRRRSTRQAAVVLPLV